MAKKGNEFMIWFIILLVIVAIASIMFFTNDGLMGQTALGASPSGASVMAGGG